MQDLTLTNPINDLSSSYGSKILTSKKSDLKNKHNSSSDCSFKVHIALVVLGLLGFGVSTGFAIAEQMKDDQHRSRRTYTLCCFAAGIASALFYHSACPQRLRKKIDFYLSATLVETVFAAGLVYRNIHSQRDKEIMHGVTFASLFGFHALRNLLIKLSLSPTDFDLPLARTENPERIFPGFFPSTRDLKGTAIMLAWYALVCTGLGGLYGATKGHFTDDLNDIGVYQNGVAALIGGLAVLPFILLGVHGMEKFEKYYKTIKEPSWCMKGVQFLQRTITINFSLFSSSIQGILFQVLKSLHASLPTTWQIREAANSGLSFAIMMIAGGVYTAQCFLKKKEKEDPLAMCHKIKAVEPKKICPETCKADWKTCKKVIKTIFPYILLLGMMAVFGVILGMTKSDVIKGAAWGIESTFVLMGIATLYFGDQAFETLENIESGLAEWKIKCANAARFFIQTPEVPVPLFMYFTNKFSLDDSHLKIASQALLSGMITGLIFYAIVYVQYRFLYRSDPAAPLDVPYLALMHLSNFFAQGLTAQGNHT